ncbi:class I SAM-dependent methyltransferase [bacterium]|nr:class I SAM-dependent methyltransferase [bacterium]
MRCCEVCGRDEKYFKLHLNAKKNLNEGLSDEFSVVRCSCGFVFRHPLEDDNEIYSFYNDEYFKGNGYDPGFFKKLEIDTNLVEENKTLIKDISRKLKINFSEGNKFLDIGCCTGESLIAAEELGFDSYGVEVSKELCDFNNNNRKLKIFNGVLKDANLKDNFFDLIVSVETLEHVPDPNVFFSEISRILKPGGIAYIETGNVNCWKAKHPPKRHGTQWFYFNRLHIFYYSPKSIKKMLKKHGLKKIAIEPFPFFYEVFHTNFFKNRFENIKWLGFFLSPCIYLGMVLKDYFLAQGFACYITKSE